jgi:hypothetical protein
MLKDAGYETLKKRSNVYTSVERLYSEGQRLVIRLLRQRRRKRKANTWRVRRMLQIGFHGRTT